MHLINRAARLAATARRHAAALFIAATSLFVPPIVVLAVDPCLHSRMP